MLKLTINKVKSLISSDLEYFLKSTQRLIFGNSLTTASAFIISMILSRALGPDGRGVVAWITSLIVLSSIFAQLGMSAINKRFAAEDKSKAGDLALFTISIILCTSLIIAPIFYFYSMSQEAGQLNKSIVIIGLLIIPIMSVADSLVEIVIGLNYIKSYNLIFILSKFLNLVLVILLVLLSAITPLTAMIAVMCSLIFQMTLTILSLKKSIHLHLNLSKIRWVLTHLKGHIFGNYIAQILSTIASSIPIIILTSKSSLKDVGIFAVGITLINVVGAFFSNMGKSYLVLLPTIHDKKRRNKLKKNFMITSLIMALPVAAVLYFTAFLSIPLIFGDNFGEAVIALKILSIGLVFNILHANAQSIIISESSGFAIIQSPLIIILLVFASSWLLIPEYGFIGAATAWGISRFFGLLSTGFTLARIKNIK